MHPVQTNKNNWNFADRLKNPLNSTNKHRVDTILIITSHLTTFFVVHVALPPQADKQQTEPIFLK